MRNAFHGVVGRQDVEIARSHTNPLFNSRSSDIGNFSHAPGLDRLMFLSSYFLVESWIVKVYGLLLVIELLQQDANNYNVESI